MQPAPGGGGSSSSGGAGAGELTRAGLARFRSAPATWLEALLEEDEEDPLKPNQCLTQLLTADAVSPSPETRKSASFTSSAGSGLFESSGFQRQNSSPANFLRNSTSGSEGFLSTYGIPENYEYLLPGANVSLSNKRAREADLEHQSPTAKFSSQMKVEQSGLSGMMDADMERLLEDSVPCRVRAKRGFATHPRSIAERVRRTRISDRIRKLQDLVPNMDKQTNTADMLDEAVEYVKHLQKQIEELTEHQRKCQCKAKEVEEGT